MLEIYGDKACMKLAYIDLNKYINLLKQRAIELEEKVTEIKQSLKVNANSKKTKTKYHQLNQQLESLNKK